MPRLARNPSPILLISDMTASVAPDAMLTRATPIRSSSAAGGEPARADDIDWRMVERLHQPGDDVHVDEPERIDAVRACGEVGLGPAYCLVEAARGIADILDVEVHPRIDDRRNAGGLRRLARRANPRDRVPDRANRHIGLRRAVLKVEADRAGVA